LANEYFRIKEGQKVEALERIITGRILNDVDSANNLEQSYSVSTVFEGSVRKFNLGKESIKAYKAQHEISYTVTDISKPR
jgi:hypothetical protein